MYVADFSITTTWRPLTRVAFRFGFVYFTLYVFFTQMLGGLIAWPGGELPDFGTVPPMRNVVTWTAAHVFRVKAPLVITGSGSGDKTFDWVLACCLLVIAIAVTTVWTAGDRRTQYAGLHKWFRLFLRFALGSTLLSYGSVKLVPLQMPAPNLTRLVEPFGNFSPMGVLWASIGASRAYEMFTGIAEITAGVLLFIPGLTTLGALIALADVIEVFLLNMTYDVPVKLFSFHLILLSLVLLAPEATRLTNVIVLNRAAPASSQTPLASSRRARRTLVAVQCVFGAYLVATALYTASKQWSVYGGGAPKSALYGIWNVDELQVDGQTFPPLLTKTGHWRRVLFDGATRVSFQQMDDTMVNYAGSVDPIRHRIELGPNVGSLAYERPSPDRLTLDGTMQGHHTTMRLTLFDRSRFVLVSRGFHWVQEYPFNR
jgi:uncharacterized membrane protein YphA (DoxX/SURF4 family)